MEGKDPQSIRLTEMEKGQRGRVISIDAPDLATAMLRMGLAPGETFVFTDSAPFGGPIALRLDGGKVALRRFDARHILVQPLG